jgi:hypothetical protein
VNPAHSEGSPPPGSQLRRGRFATSRPTAGKVLTRVPARVACELDRNNVRTDRAASRVTWAVTSPKGYQRMHSRDLYFVGSATWARRSSSTTSTSGGLGERPAAVRGEPAKGVLRVRAGLLPAKPATDRGRRGHGHQGVDRAVAHPRRDLLLREGPPRPAAGPGQQPEEVSPERSPCASLVPERK